MELEYLDGEILSNILKRLSAEGVFRLIFSCKRWYSLINHPHFINAHLALQHQQSHHLLIQSQVQDGELRAQEGEYKASLVCVDEEIVEHEKTLDDLLQGCELIGSCNGLVLMRRLVDIDTLCIVNLVTRYRYQLPPCNPVGNFCTFAFSFVPATNEYKVVYFYTFHSNGETTDYNCQILTIPAGGMNQEDLEALAWEPAVEDLDFFDLEIQDTLFPVLLDDGNLVWKDEPNHRIIMLSFHARQISECMFPIENENPNVPSYLLNKDGSLAFVTYVQNGDIMTVWTIDWNTGIWNRLDWSLYMPTVRRVFGTDNSHHLTPHFISRTHKLVLFTFQNRYFEYSIRDQETKEIVSLRNTAHLFCANHVESLVSLRRVPED